MAFTHSMSTRVLVGGIAASAELSSVDAQNSRAMSETTAFVDTGQRFIPGLYTGTLSLQGRFDGAGDLHTALDDARGVNDALQVTTGPAGLAIGSPVFTAVGDLTSHGITAAVADAVALSVETTADQATEIGVSLHDLSAETAGGDGAAVDHGSSTSGDAVAVLHVTEVSGTSAAVDVVLQHSADDATYVDLATFSQVTAAGAQRLAVSGPVERYVRATWSLSGTSPSATFTTALAR